MCQHPLTQTVILSAQDAAHPLRATSAPSQMTVGFLRTIYLAREALDADGDEGSGIDDGRDGQTVPMGQSGSQAVRRSGGLSTTQSISQSVSPCGKEELYPAWHVFYVGLRRTWRCPYPALIQRAGRNEGWLAPWVPRLLDAPPPASL